MLVSLKDIAAKCPLRKWYDHTHTVIVDFSTGETFVLRSTLKNMRGFKCTVDMLRGSTLLQHKEEDTLLAVADLVNHRVKQLAGEQVRIAELSAMIVKDIHAGEMTLPVLRIVGEALFDILAGYEPHATLSGWRSWLNLCEAYFIQGKPKENT